DRAAGPGRKAPTEDRADVRVASGLEHALLQAANRLDRLRVEHAVLDVLDRDRATAPFERLQTRPERLLRAFGIVVEAAAMRPAHAPETVRHLLQHVDSGFRDTAALYLVRVPVAL